jgi:AmpD protein
LNIDRKSGWIEGVTHLVSPNCDARPQGSELDLIVIHGISLPPGDFGGPWIDRLFTNGIRGDEHAYFAEICGLRVSAHVLIRRDGSVTQYVPFLARAWHAGESVHCGRSSCNDFSVGIELEGSDDIPYAEIQYTHLVKLVGALRRTYAGLRTADIVGHSDIAPGRKTDPGSHFDWVRFRRDLAAAGR